MFDIIYGFMKEEIKCLSVRLNQNRKMLDACF